MKDRLKALLGVSGTDRERPMPEDASAPKWTRASGPLCAPMQSRHSHGLDQFFTDMRGQERLSILDLGGASQANVAFITGLGHRLYSEDFLRNLDEAFASEDGDTLAGQNDPERVEAFLDQNLSPKPVAAKVDAVS